MWWHVLMAQWNRVAMTSDSGLRRQLANTSTQMHREGGREGGRLRPEGHRKSLPPLCWCALSGGEGVDAVISTWMKDGEPLRSTRTPQRTGGRLDQPQEGRETQFRPSLEGRRKRRRREGRRRRRRRRKKHQLQAAHSILELCFFVAPWFHPP